MRMKTLLRSAAVIVFAAIGAAAVWSGSTPLSRSAAAANELATAYGTHCANCHGADGRANTAKGRELDADDLTTAKVQGMSTAKLTRIIKNGKGDMPAFKNLTAAQLSSIIRKVKSF